MSGLITKTLNTWDTKYRVGTYVRIHEMQWLWLRKRVKDLEDHVTDLLYENNALHMDAMLTSERDDDIGPHEWEGE